MSDAPSRRLPKGFVADPFAYHHELELGIETLTNLGLGLGRVDGWVVMVPFALPGERVLARVHRNHKNYSEADLMRVIEASPARVEPRCALFGKCGGCQYQNLRYEEQLVWKRRQLAELLKHMARIEFPVEEVVASPQEYDYRSKITPHFDKPRDGRIAEIGFLKAGSRHHIIDVPHCDIAMPTAPARNSDGSLVMKPESRPAPICTPAATTCTLTAELGACTVFIVHGVLEPAEIGRAHV